MSIPSDTEKNSFSGLLYLAIAVGVAFESYAFSIAVQNIKKEMRKEKHKNFFSAVRRSKDPATLTVFFEDLLALAGLFIAAVAITLVKLTGILIIDALASIVIGVLLMMFSLLLAHETKELLVGEAVTRHKRRMLLAAVNGFEEFKQVISLKTMHLSPEEKIIPVAKVYLEAENR